MAEVALASTHERELAVGLAFLVKSAPAFYGTLLNYPKKFKDRE